MQRSTAQPIDVDSQRTRTAFEESDLVSRSVRSVPCEHQENTAAPQQRHPQSGTTTQVTTVSTDQLCLTNARLVLRGEVISGSIQIADGKITAVDSGTSTVGEDLQQDYLLPGLVELHTDHIESHFAPRPGVRWSCAPSTYCTCDAKSPHRMLWPSLRSSTKTIGCAWRR